MTTKGYSVFEFFQITLVSFLFKVSIDRIKTAWGGEGLCQLTLPHHSLSEAGVRAETQGRN